MTKIPDNHQTSGESQRCSVFLFMYLIASNMGSLFEVASHYVIGSNNGLSSHLVMEASKSPTPEEANGDVAVLHYLSWKECSDRKSVV